MIYRLLAMLTKYVIRNDGPFGRYCCECGRSATGNETIDHHPSCEYDALVREQQERGAYAQSSRGNFFNRKPE